MSTTTTTPNPYASDFLLSPDGVHLARRHPESLAGRQGAPWHCTDGSRLRDDQVRDWSPMRAMSREEVRETLERREADFPSR